MGTYVDEEWVFHIDDGGVENSEFYLSLDELEDRFNNIEDYLETDELVSYFVEPASLITMIFHSLVSTRDRIDYIFYQRNGKKGEYLHDLLLNELSNLQEVIYIELEQRANDNDCDFPYDDKDFMSVIERDWNKVVDVVISVTAYLLDSLRNEELLDELDLLLEHGNILNAEIDAGAKLLFVKVENHIRNDF